MDARVAVLENEVRHLKEDMAELKQQLSSANAKLDRLVQAANMGKGAWWASVKIGGLLVMALGAVAWVADHVVRFFR